MSASNKLTITDFKCMICQEVIAFDINDSNTFVTSSIIEEFFSMKLTRFEVKHDNTDEEHVNIVIVDQDGRYRGHKDGYVEKKKESQISVNYEISTTKLVSHEKIELFLVLDTSKHTIKEFINDAFIKSINIVQKLEPFIKQNIEIYEIFPSQLIFTFANKNFYIMMIEENIFCCFTFKNESNSINEKFFSLFEILKSIINGSADNSPLLKLIYTILNISNLNKFEKEDLEYINKMLGTDVFFSELQIKPEYIGKIQQIKSDFLNEFSCAILVLDPILYSKSNLLDIIESNINQYRCIIDFIEFLNRRRLFLFKT